MTAPADGDYAVGFTRRLLGDRTRASSSGCAASLPERVSLRRSSAAAGGGWFALGAAGKDSAPAGVAGRSPATPKEQVELPPLPTKARARRRCSRSRVADGRRRRAVAPDPGLTSDDGEAHAARPPRPCRARTRRQRRLQRRHAGDRARQRRRAAAARGARGGQADHRGRQRHRAHARTSGAAATASGWTRATTARARSRSRSPRRAC